MATITSEERLNRFNVEGIKRDTKIYIRRDIDAYEYELSVRATNILNKVELPEGETTIEELCKYRWCGLRVLREYIETGVIKKVSPKPKSIKDVKKVRTFLRRLWQKFQDVYFGVQQLKVADCDLVPIMEGEIKAFYIYVEVEGDTSGIYKSKRLLSEEWAYHLFRELERTQLIDPNTEMWNWEEGGYVWKEENHADFYPHQMED